MTSKPPQLSRILMGVALILFGSVAGHTQADSDNSGDTSGAEATITAIQQSANVSTQNQQQPSALDPESCKRAVAYVESQDGLLGEWDRTVRDYATDSGRMADIQKIKAELLSYTWWARSSGPDVARAVSTFSSLLIDVYAALTPAGKAIDFAKAFGSEVQERSALIFEAIEAGHDGVEAVKEGTDGLAIWAVKTELKQIGQGQLAASISIFQQVQKNAEIAHEGAEFKQTVQEQLSKLETEMTKYGQDADLQKEKMEALESMREAVIAACNSSHAPQAVPVESSQETTPPIPVQTQAPPQGFQQQATPAPPTVPWWVTALSSLPARIEAARPGQPESNPARNPERLPCCPPGGRVCC